MPKAKTTKKVTPKTETLVNFILDKSGSMGSIRESTISGFNEYLKTLQNDGNRYNFSLVLFETAMLDLYTNEPIKNIKPLTIGTYVPDGMTALYDSVCQTIENVKRSVKKNQKVLTVIMTDGEENSSNEFTQKDMREKIQELEKSGNWTFVFLGANQDSYATAQAVGINVMNTANFVQSDAGMKSAMRTMATGTSNFAMSAMSSTSSFFSRDDQQNLQNSGTPNLNGNLQNITSSNTVDPAISAHFSALGKKGYEAKRKKILGE